MRLYHPDGTTVHLSYCTNVHAAESLEGILAQLDTYAVPVRERLGADVLGLGLWLAAPVAAGLAGAPGDRQRLRRALDARGLEVVTLNGFPYQAFQEPVVKHAVYQPDWTTPQRLAYTRDLARVLTDLLPGDAARGSISTLPLAWHEPWDAGRASACRRALDELARDLHELPRPVRVAFEPEPGCIIETTEEAVALLGEADTSVLGVCLDLAHLACAWEEPAQALRRLREAGLPVVKTQISAALASADPRRDAAVLGEYAEPRFLHQTRGSSGLRADDLDAALATPGGDAQPWRVHYHVPLHSPPVPPLRSTVDVLAEALRELLGGDTADCDHLDVETYTWHVLPPASRPAGPAELASGIAAELFFARAQLAALGLATAQGVPS
ncbi:metabolite traffic protein EboE [Couchioplanes caeruleus]|uniref:Xylose isomerase n=2 Tax=Couchioplanes caeruleus TaxID=56438 RepID=A0A1K0GK57_9ACTN|nr:metabolite traffic protein EboE [Couchioplanes caeruleus]OJF12662.1 xylose isomerase [Couchioplanes caeruleus subsp. caeruleus]ROP27446.1 sugar phosphate isomerase/epimerase [Couchioplanes caeruleus]